MCIYIPYGVHGRIWKSKYLASFPDPQPKLVSVAGVAHFITGQTQLNRVCLFNFFGIFLAFKGFNYSEFIAYEILQALQHYSFSRMFSL